MIIGHSRHGRLHELLCGFSDIGVGSGRTSRSLVWSAFCCRVLQGLPQSIDDRGNVARADIAASASASRSDGWYPHEVALDQLHRVQGREQTRGTLETLQSAHGT